jgi:hypothetical protein
MILGEVGRSAGTAFTFFPSDTLLVYPAAGSSLMGNGGTREICSFFRLSQIAILLRVPLRKMALFPCCCVSALNFKPQNAQSIPAVEIFACNFQTT